MSTTSPNFNLVLATASDVVAVDSHIANNFSTLDSVVGKVITGTGRLITSIPMTSPVLTNPIIIGTASGASLIIASTANFSSVTAAAGAVTLTTFSIGTYSYPTAIGSTSAVLTVVTGNAQWAAAAPNTGANQALSNLAAVALNTSLGTGTAGFFTVDRIIATSGALTGITSFQATTGTFTGNVVISGTATINAVNCTGGAGTFGTLGIGTYTLPAVLGSSGQILKVSTGTLGFYTPSPIAVFCLVSGSCSGAAVVGVSAFTTVYDPAGSATATGYTTPSSGVYNITLMNMGQSGTVSTVVLAIATTNYTLASVSQSMQIIQTIAAGVVISATATFGGGNGRVNQVNLSGFKMFDL